MLDNKDSSILEILNKIKNNNFVTIPGIQDSFKDNVFNNLIVELFDANYFTEKPIRLTDKGILYLEQLEKRNKQN